MAVGSLHFSFRKWIIFFFITVLRMESLAAANLGGDDDMSISLYPFRHDYKTMWRFWWPADRPQSAGRGREGKLSRVTVVLQSHPILLRGFAFQFLVLNNNICEANDQLLPHFDFELPEHLKRPTPSKVHRLERNWTVVSPHYSPVVWNARCMEKQCDPPYGEFRAAAYRLDDERIDRKRAMCCCKEHHYRGQNGMPLNPAGRTGLAGRGLLPRFGPNHYMKIFFVKKENERYFILSLNGSSSVDMSNAFFEGFVDHPKDDFYPAVLHNAIYFDLKAQFNDEKKVEKIMKKGRKTSVRILEGSVPSYMNTDNAWVEGHVFMVLCEKNDDLCDYGLKTVQMKQGYDWELWNREASIETTRRLAKEMPDDETARKELAGYSIFCQGCDPSMKYTILGTLGLSSFIAVVLGIRFGILAVWFAALTASIVGAILTPIAVLITVICVYDFVERIRHK